MKERPILFSSPMVRALLSGTKTQTRRVAKFPYDPPEGFYPDLYNHGEQWTFWGPRGTEKSGQSCLPYIKCPYGQPGDRLWVRETCRAEELESGLDGVRYLADDAFIPIENSPEAAEKWVSMHNYRWGKGLTVPAIHMPRRASRITLEVTGVRVERLKDISADDCMAEGAVVHRNTGDLLDRGIIKDDWRWRNQYHALWEEINGPDSWEANPWVWVIEFKRTN